MARRRRGRDTNDIANPYSDPLNDLPLYRLPAPRPLVDVADYTDYARLILNQPPVNLDGRAWHPDPSPNVNKTRSGTRGRITLSSAAHGIFSTQTKARRAFSDPGGIMTCVRRKIRKEVMHALRKAGKGGAQKPRVIKESSKIKC